MGDHCEHGYLDGKCIRCDIAHLRTENERLTKLLAASESVRRNADARMTELGERLAALRAALEQTPARRRELARVLVESTEEGVWEQLTGDERDKAAAGIGAVLQAITTGGEAAGGVADCSCGTNAQHAPGCPAHPGYRPAASQDVGTVGSGEREP